MMICKKMKHISLFIILLIGICLNGAASQHRSLEDEIQEVMKEYRAIGASVVVVKDNGICYHRSFEWSER